MNKALLLAVVVVVSAASVALAVDTPASTGTETIVTLSGVKYENAVVTTVTPTTITVTYPSGVARIPFVNLPVDVQKQYGYDSAKAAAYKAQLAESEQAKHKDTTTNGSTELGAKYRDGVNAALARTVVTEVTDIPKVIEFLSESTALSSAMEQRATAIFTKWVDASSSLARSGLSETGDAKVFLKQFTQEEALENTRLLTDTRTVKDSLVGSRIHGTERLQLALNTLFTNYASICELDRTPSAHPADFLYDLRIKMEFFGVNYLAYANEMKALEASMEARVRKKESP